MQPFYLMKNPIKDYAWGHSRHIPEMLGIDWPTGKPAAEVWMGAHRSAPSEIDNAGSPVRLDTWIDGDKEGNLGEKAAQEYPGLPFLFKFLAAGKSLSIQAHPDKSTAESGFEKEEFGGVPVDSPIRNYKDDNHKPEIIMALNPFTAMIGFRDPVDVYANIGILPAAVEGLVASATMAALKNGDESALKSLLKEILTGESRTKNQVLAQAVETARNAEGRSIPWDNLQRRWIPKLAEQFPSDIGALAPLFLHVVQINPGEGLYQPERMLHAYLEGFGLELMANSDNVLRGGLTPKNVDVPELLKILDFRASEPRILKLPEDRKPNTVSFFPTPAQEFALGIGEVDDDVGNLRITEGEGPLIALCLEGTIVLRAGDHELNLNRGQSAYIPFQAPLVDVGGKGRLALAEIGK